MKLWVAEFNLRDEFRYQIVSFYRESMLWCVIHNFFGEYQARILNYFDFSNLGTTY